jgi:repressor LexA
MALRLCSGLTPRQEIVLNFLRRYVIEHIRPPTVREICRELGIRSPNGVTNHLKALEKKGFIRRDDPNASRGLIVVGLKVVEIDDDETLDT